MFEYEVDNIIIYNTSVIDTSLKSESGIENIISVWIVNNLEKDIIYDIIEKNYEGFSDIEKQEIMSKILMETENSKNDRINYIENKLRAYFEREKSINIMGFIRFRLKDYRFDLEKITDKIIDKYLCEKEYYEFINLIREYLLFQDAEIPLIHIHSKKHGYRYLDENGKDITKLLDRKYSVQADLTQADKLLTILILSAPHRIIWHNWENDDNLDLKKTVEEIFGEKVEFSKNCKIYKNN